MSCKNCFFYTGVQCHGHGDFWGDCNLAIVTRINPYNLDRIDSLWSAIRYDDSNECRFKVDDGYDLYISFMKSIKADLPVYSKPDKSKF